MPSHQVRILHLTIDVPLDAAYAFAHRPENFPKWASGLSSSLDRGERGWIAQTPDGEAQIEFSEPNAHGVLDHRVRIPGQPEVLIPLRLVANGEGTEIELMLFRQPGMTDAMFERDAGMVMVDLRSLKALLETGG